MSESKKVPLESSTSFQKDKKSKDSRPTLRFDLTLAASDDSSYAEFSYKELVKNIERKNRAKLLDDPFDDDDDEEKLQEIARKLEEKYNPRPCRRKRRKANVCEDYVDRGMGYDETDPFIDNGEAYDELVPSTLTTKYGGFYINKGELDFRNISENDMCVEAKVRKKRRKQREANNFDQKRKKRLATDDENPKRRGRKPMSTNDTSAPSKVKKRHQPTVADMLQQHKAQLQLQQQEKLKQIQVSPITVERNLEPEINEPERPQSAPVDQGINSTISEAIESVVKAAAEDALSNGSGGPITGSSDGEEIANKPSMENKEAPKLPENLPQDLDSLVSKLKQAAYNSEEGKCKFFSEDVNRMLLNVELRAQQLSSAQRSIIYSHLASHLPCTKETLQKRAKKLRLDQEDNKLREPMQRLKDAIAVVMPDLIEKYAASIDASDIKKEDPKTEAEVHHSADDDSQDDDKRQCFSKKKFLWNDTIRKYLCDVVRIKLKCYEVSKTRIQSAEEYLNHFLESEVKGLWPPGWMQARILFKESRAAHFYITNKTKRSLLLTKKPIINLPSAVITVKPAVSVLNNIVTSQEPNTGELVPQTDKIVPSDSVLPPHTESYEKAIDCSKPSSVSASVDENVNQEEFSKLLTQPIKSEPLSDALFTSNIPSTESKLTELPVQSKSISSISSQNSLDHQKVSSQLLDQQKASPQVHAKQSVSKCGKISEVSSFPEGSLASDMLARIISASLADFPYASSSSIDNIPTKIPSVITSSANFNYAKDSARTVNSKVVVEAYTSPKKVEDTKAFNPENRKASQESLTQNLLTVSNNQIETLLNTHQSSKQNDISSSLIKSHGGLLDTVKSPMNLKLKDVVVPQSRQFAEAFERVAETLPVRKLATKTHPVKSTAHIRLPVSSINTTLRYSNASELLNEPTSSASARTFENPQRAIHDLHSKLTTNAPYKKRTKYTQSGKGIEQWHSYLDGTLGPSLLEGMKGFPFPVNTLPTPPPAHCSTSITPAAQLKDNTFPVHTHNQRSAHVLSSVMRILGDPRPESTTHNQQTQARLPATEGSRRQSLIKSSWKNSPTTQSSTSHSHYLTSGTSAVQNSTSPNQSSSVSHQNPTIVYAHSHSTSPPAEKTPAFSHNQNQLTPRASPSPVQTSRTSPSSAHSPHISQTFLPHQTSHSISSHQIQPHSLTSATYDHAHTSASASVGGTYTYSQEQKTNPRSNQVP